MEFDGCFATVRRRVNFEVASTMNGMSLGGVIAAIALVAFFAVVFGGRNG